jgi:hypothetical protein
VLALALGYFGFDKFVLDPQRESEQLAEIKLTQGFQATCQEGVEGSFVSSITTRYLV